MLSLNYNCLSNIKCQWFRYSWLQSSKLDGLVETMQIRTVEIDAASACKEKRIDIRIFNLFSISVSAYLLIFTLRIRLCNFEMMLATIASYKISTVRIKLSTRYAAPIWLKKWNIWLAWKLKNIYYTYLLDWYCIINSQLYQNASQPIRPLLQWQDKEYRSYSFPKSVWIFKWIGCRVLLIAPNWATHCVP